MTESSSTAMKPLTAAKKLGIYLPAAPEEFQTSAVSREEFHELQTNPPQWLRDLRAHGPHPREVVAAKLKITIAALKRHDLADRALTTAEIAALLEEAPAWLHEEQRTLAQQRAEQQAAAERAAAKAAARQPLD